MKKDELVEKLWDSQLIHSTISKITFSLIQMIINSYGMGIEFTVQDTYEFLTEHIKRKGQRANEELNIEFD